tara:strand:- start:2531 stop:3322 length:792 start_codon:yes stop_codon:yes gene_type:complete
MPTYRQAYDAKGEEGKKTRAKYKTFKEFETAAKLYNKNAADKKKNVVIDDQGNKGNPSGTGPGSMIKKTKDTEEGKIKASNAALHAKLTKLTETDDKGNYKDQTAYNKHMATVAPKDHTKKVVDKANDPKVLNKNQGGSREIYTPIATDTRENTTNQNMVNKASNNKSVTQNYNPPTTKLSLQDYHQANLKKAANKPKVKVEDTSQAALEKKFGLASTTPTTSTASNTSTTTPTSNTETKRGPIDIFKGMGEMIKRSRNKGSY